jgi:hypothetical protein
MYRTTEYVRNKREKLDRERSADLLQHFFWLFRLFRTREMALYKHDCLEWFTQDTTDAQPRAAQRSGFSNRALLGSFFQPKDFSNSAGVYVFCEPSSSSATYTMCSSMPFEPRQCPSGPMQIQLSPLT